MSESTKHRLNIEVTPEEHRKIKMFAAMRDETVRSYVLKAVRAQLQEDLALEVVQTMAAWADPVLAELWSNEMDAAYDSL